MNTEKTKSSPADSGGLIGHSGDRNPLSFFSAPRRLENFPRREGVGVAPSVIGRRMDHRRSPGLGPGGTPKEISRGQARASGRSPRLSCQTRHAPAGHRRNLWRRPSRCVSTTARCLGQIASPTIARHPSPFLRCPAGAPDFSPRFPGAASAAADLPPANLLRCPSGTENGRQLTDSAIPRCEDFGARAVPARSGHAPATVLEISTAPAPMLPLRPGTGRAPHWLRLRRSVFIVSLWSCNRVSLHRHG